MRQSTFFSIKLEIPVTKYWLSYEFKYGRITVIAYN